MLAHLKIRQRFVLATTKTILTKTAARKTTKGYIITKTNVTSIWGMLDLLN